MEELDDLVNTIESFQKDFTQLNGLSSLFKIKAQITWIRVKLGNRPNFTLNGQRFDLKDLLVKQIESRVRWRESILFMANKGVKQFIEIGPGKVLSGLIKRIDKNVKVSAINNEEDIKSININD